MKISFSQTTCVLAMMLTSIALQAETVFKWTDANGEVHYGDRPPGVGAEGVEKKHIDSNANTTKALTDQGAAGKPEQGNNGEILTIGKSEGGAEGGAATGGGPGGGPGGGGGAAGGGAGNGGAGGGDGGGNGGAEGGGEGVADRGGPDAGPAAPAGNGDGKGQGDGAGGADAAGGGNGGDGVAAAAAAGGGAAPAGGGAAPAGNAPKAGGGGAAQGNAPVAPVAPKPPAPPAPKPAPKADAPAPKGPPPAPPAPAPVAEEEPAPPAPKKEAPPVKEAPPPPPPVADNIIPQPDAITAEADFRRRCATPGVISCVDFDNSAVLDGRVANAWDKNKYASIDKSVKASGSGSLRFDLQPNSQANTAGWWQLRFGKENGDIKFGENKKLYFQFKQRFDTTMTSMDLSGGGWKQFVLHEYPTPCASLEMAQTNGYYRAMPMLYTHCGASGFSKKLGKYNRIWQHSGEPTQGYYCRRSDYVNYEKAAKKDPNAAKPAGCAFYEPNQWMTFYFEVEIGEFGVKNSKVRAYLSHQGEPLQMYVYSTTKQFDGGDGQGFDTIILTPYITGKKPAVNHPVAQTWYDELIISTKPIPAPVW